MKNRTRQLGFRGIAVMALILFAGAARADTLVLKDTKTLAAIAFRRNGSFIVAVSEVPGPDGKPRPVERSIPISEIVRVESTYPAAVRDALPQMAAGNAAAALPALDLAAKAAAPLGSLPGSYWPELVSLQAQVLIASGKDREAEPLAAALKADPNPAVAASGQAITALIGTRTGGSATALPAAIELHKLRHRPDARPGTVAAASVACGLGYLERNEPVAALKSFLELPVFLPNEIALNGIVQLGIAKCHLAMVDYDRAIATLESLIEKLPGAPETAQARTLLPEWQRLRTVANEKKAAAAAP